MMLKTSFSFTPYNINNYSSLFAWKKVFPLPFVVYQQRKLFSTFSRAPRKAWKKFLRMALVCYGVDNMNSLTISQGKKGKNSMCKSIVKVNPQMPRESQFPLFSISIHKLLCHEKKSIFEIFFAQTNYFRTLEMLSTSGGFF